MKPSIPDLVLITWDDAATDDGWELHSDYKPIQELICHTVGYVLTRNKKSIEVAQTWSVDQTGARWRIPMKMVLKIEVLRKGKR